MSKAGFSYDIFVSYRHKEPSMAWVRNTFVPHLETAGISAIIDYRDFQLGALLIKEMARAVETSRYTVAILTPEYLESNFTELENVMAQQVGLEESEIRLLIIMREACKPGLDIRSKFWLDMSDDTKFHENAQKLINYLQRTL